MPSPRSWYQPVGYSTIVGTDAAPPVTTGGWSYTYEGVAASTMPDPTTVPGNTRPESRGRAPCRAAIVRGGQNFHGSTGCGNTLGSRVTNVSRATNGAPTTPRFV